MPEDNERDVTSLLATLRAISDHPDRFSLVAVSIAARTAHDVIRGSDAMPLGTGEEIPQCEGQLTIMDMEAS